jgi:hypothetical protein
MDNSISENRYGILGGAFVSAPTTFVEVRKHPWLNAPAPWFYSNDLPAIPDDAIDALVGNAPVYWGDVEDARALFRSACLFYAASVRHLRHELRMNSVIKKAAAEQKRKLENVSTRDRKRFRALSEKLVADLRDLKPTALALQPFETLAGASSMQRFRIALYGELPKPSPGIEGRPPSEWPDSLLEFAWLFRKESRSTQSKASFAGRYRTLRLKGALITEALHACL